MTDCDDTARSKDYISWEKRILFYSQDVPNNRVTIPGAKKRSYGNERSLKLKTHLFLHDAIVSIVVSSAGKERIAWKA
jgi:hypothetical protein